jgi:hypothetical protein
MESGNFADALESAVPESEGLASRDPTAFLLVESTENEIEQVVRFPFGMVTCGARRTTTYVNGCRYRHSPTLLSQVSLASEPTIRDLILGQVLTDSPRRVYVQNMKI